MPRKPPRNRRRKRAYLLHGLHALKGALARAEEGQDWTEQLEPVGGALRAWRTDLIAALGGEAEVSPQRRALVELATRTHLMLESVDRFVLGMWCLVNKSKRQALRRSARATAARGWAGAPPGAARPGAQGKARRRRWSSSWSGWLASTATSSRRMILRRRPPRSRSAPRAPRRPRSHDEDGHGAGHDPMTGNAPVSVRTLRRGCLPCGRDFLVDVDDGAWLGGASIGRLQQGVYLLPVGAREGPALAGERVILAATKGRSS